MSKEYSRRHFLRLAAAGAAGAIAVACQPKTVIVEKEVEKTVVVEKEVEKTVVVEKEVEKVVKETVVVEKEVEKVVTPTPEPEEPGAIAEVPRNRTLIMAGLGGEHFGGFTDIELFNPYVSGTSRSGFYQSGTEGLFYYNMIGDTFHPWLAESYEYSEDYMSLTLNIRKGVEWSDGTPFTAKDVVFSILLCRDNDILARSAEFKRFVEDAEAVDDFTAKFTFKVRAPRFHWDYLTFRADVGHPIVPEHVFKDQDPETFSNYDPAKGWPLVTGPYKLVATDVNQKIWDLRPDWWAAKTGFQPLPKVERQIHLPGMNEITMAQMMIANEIDMAFSFTPANMQLVQGQNDKIISHCPRPPYAFRDWWPGGLGLNTSIPPFDDKDIRWAMSYALDRDEVIQFAFSGFGEPVDGPFPKYPGLQKYRDSIQDLYDKYPTNEFNPAKTEEIMTGKGYTKDGDGFWVKDGARITFEIVTFPQHPSMTPVVPVVTEQLRRAGFDATFLLPADFGTRIATGDAKAFMWGHGGAMKDTYKTLDLYHCQWVKPVGEAGWPNIYRWCNEEFSEVVTQMASYELDAPEMMDLHRQAMTIWLDELPDIPVMETMIVLPMNTTYWKGWPSCDDQYVHEGFWHRTAMLMWPRLEPTQ
jgi:peptide/nickel transport system substrate-binding protein